MSAPFLLAISEQILESSSVQPELVAHINLSPKPLPRFNKAGADFAS